MEEEKAHELYSSFAAVDQGARVKQGIGFAGRGVQSALKGWQERDDDDVIARNRRMQYSGSGQDAKNRDDDEGYDSDTADAVKRRLRHLAREQREQQPAAGAAAAPLPGCLYDERVERKQLEQQQRQQQKVEQQLEQQRRSGSREQRSGDRHGSREHRGERHRSRERHAERRRSRSRSQERQHMRRRSRSRSRERRHGHTDHRSSSHRQRSRSRERRLGSGGAGGAGNAAGLQRLDFEAIIPGYSAMTAPQKLKAKTQYLLERSTAKDQQQQERDRREAGEAQVQAQWTRYRFDASAELEEDRRLPEASHGGEGLGAEEEPHDEATGGLGVSGVTFKESNAAAVQQERDQSHAAAIFGGAGGSSGHAAAAAAGSARRASQAAPQHKQAAASWEGAAGSTEDLIALAEADGAVVVPSAEVAVGLSAQQQPTAAAGGALSWRERALAAKRARQQ